ncbi:MAG TPA: response regulator transcription factor [Herbaspirillum sp.]|nr:response regulator transcription factor [Herbaspirillum sp.]
MPLRIAILNNDAGQLALLSGALQAYRCDGFRSPAELLQFQQSLPAADQTDLFLLDLHTLQGHADAMATLLATARAAKAPVLLSATHSEAAALESALTAGADDYVLKPLRRNEVLLRVQILLKRAHPEYRNAQQIRFAQYVFETPSHRITHAGVDIDVTQKEFELALLLFGNLGRPLSRAYIQDAIWSRSDQPDQSDLPSRTLDTHISRVRNKLQLKPEQGFRLTPVYGYGYQLEQIGKQHAQ